MPTVFFPSTFRPISTLIGVQGASIANWTAKAAADAGAGADAFAITATLILLDTGTGTDSGLRQYGIVGFVKDQLGAVIVGATVEVYEADNDLFISTTTSAADGSYITLINDKTKQYYVRAYNDSYLSQRVFGVTDRTLVAT